MRNVSDKCCGENQNTFYVKQFLFHPPPRKSCLFKDNVEKYCGAGQTTDDNVAYGHCMLDNSGCKHTLRVCNTCCFSTITMVARTRLSVTLQ
jgi:hypothetical protein